MSEQSSLHTLSTPTSTDIVQLRRADKQRLAWGLICLIAPTALFIVTIFLYAIVNFVFGATSATPNGAETLVADPTPMWRTISNIVFFILGATAVIAWLPGIIGGIILLSTRKKV